MRRGILRRGVLGKRFPAVQLAVVPLFYLVWLSLRLAEDICEATPDMSSIRCQVPKQHVKEVPVRYTNDEL